MPSLRLENVCYRYKNGGHDVLNDVCCQFDGGRLNAIVGPSGSGKTTLLSLMAGLDKPTGGTLSVDDECLDTLDLDCYRRERVSMIFQAFQLFPMLTARENAAFPLELRGVSRAEARTRAEKLLLSVGIGKDLHRRYPARLSGGEQQRVAIARALASGAKVILADEPTGNLDTANGGRVMEILDRLAHDEGYCVIIVTHDMDIANASDNVFRMVDGTLYGHRD